jgi:hypothetical protein
MTVYIIGLTIGFILALFVRELLSRIGVSYVSCVQYGQSLVDLMVRSAHNCRRMLTPTLNERIEDMEKNQVSTDVISVVLSQIKAQQEQIASLASLIAGQGATIADNGATICDETPAFNAYLEDQYVAEQIATMSDPEPMPEPLSASTVRDPLTVQLVLNRDNTINAITCQGGAFTHWPFIATMETYKQGTIGWYSGTGQLVSWDSRSGKRTMVGVVLGLDGPYHVVCPVNDEMVKSGRITRKDLSTVRIISGAPEQSAVSWTYVGDTSQAPESTPEQIEQPTPKVAAKGKTNKVRSDLVSADLLMGQGVKVRLDTPIVVLRDSNGQMVKDSSGKIRWFSATSKKGQDIVGLQRRFRADPIRLTYREILSLAS